MTRSIKPTDLGLPTDDLSAHRLLFNPATRTTIVHVWVSREGALWGRIYARFGSEPTYVLLGSPDDEHSDDEVITCDGPFLFFRRSRGRRTDRGWGFWHEGVGRVNLADHTFDLLATETMKSRQQSVSSLQHASADGMIIHGVVATYSEDTGCTTYSICSIDFAGEQFETLIPLSTPFI
jgi:hypothetical protein